MSDWEDHGLRILLSGMAFSPLERVCCKDAALLGSMFFLLLLAERRLRPGAILFLTDPSPPWSRRN